MLVHQSLKKQLLDYMVEEIQRNYGDNPAESEAFTAIINKNNFNRIKHLLEASPVFYGGDTQEEKLHISPTLLHPCNFNDEVMQQEIFGPLLPIIEFENFSSVVPQLKAMEKPLALYVFTESSQNSDMVLKEISFGGGAVNDTIFHFANPNLPFGGVGSSGIGAYHHYEGFKTFSHMKSIINKGTVRYPKWVLSSSKNGDKKF